MMDHYRKQLEVEDDAEWQVIEKRIQQVTDARREVGLGATGLMGLGGLGAGAGGSQRGGGRLGQALDAWMGKPTAEEIALQQAREANATSAELKATLQHYRDARAQKQSVLEKAQDELRKLLSLRQEVTATLLGLL